MHRAPATVNHPHADRARNPRDDAPAQHVPARKRDRSDARKTRVKSPRYLRCSRYAHSLQDDPEKPPFLVVSMHNRCRFPVSTISTACRRVAQLSSFSRSPHRINRQHRKDKKTTRGTTHPRAHDTPAANTTTFRIAEAVRGTHVSRTRAILLTVIPAQVGTQPARVRALNECDSPQSSSGNADPHQRRRT